MRPSLAALLALLLTAPALAHDDAALDAMATPHGGQMRMAGPYHLELVVGDGELRVHLTDHADRPVSSAGVSGNAIVLSGAKSTLALAPAGDHAVAGKGSFVPTPDMKVVVSLTFPDGKAWQARFTPGARVTQAPAATPGTGGTHQHGH